MPAGAAPIDSSAVLAGDRRAIAEALNLLENRNLEKADAVRELIEAVNRASRPERHVIGITGPPGVGKSSMISRLIENYRRRGKSVGFLSVDPSSMKTGGALLGDRIKIDYKPGAPGLFIRSTAAGSHLGGLSWHTRQMLSVLEAVYDVILVETVGVGQSETEIENVVDTVVIVVQPGSGDLLQFMKAGIMEIPDVLVINKADQREWATKAFYDLSNAAALGECSSMGWKMEVVMTSAAENTGLDRLVELMDRHRRHLEMHHIAEIRRDKLHRWILSAFQSRFGLFGVDLLGGREKILHTLKQADIPHSLAGIRLLTDHLAAMLDMEISC
jgi:LAO/AO transport system kinase